MTAGIRAFTIAKFNELLPQRAELGNTEFRRSVMSAAMAMHGISLGSAATHYNHALKMAKANTPQLVEGLGRAEDKKGGRKPTHLFNVVVDAEGGDTVAQNLSRARAQELIDAAKAAGKVALKMVEVTPAADAATETAEQASTEEPQTAAIDNDGEAAADAAEAAGALNLQALEQDAPVEEQTKFDPATAEAAPF